MTINIILLINLHLFITQTLQRVLEAFLHNWLFVIDYFPEAICAHLLRVLEFIFGQGQCDEFILKLIKPRFEAHNLIGILPNLPIPVGNPYPEGLQ